MGVKKVSEGTDEAAIPPATTGDVDMVGYVDDSPPEATPDPVFAIDEDGAARPLSGGSFMRQSDGTLVRVQEA